MGIQPADMWALPHNRQQKKKQKNTAGRRGQTINLSQIYITWGLLP